MRKVVLSLSDGDYERCLAWADARKISVEEFIKRKVRRGLGRRVSEKLQRMIAARMAGKTHAEIGAAEGITKQAVQSALVRAGVNARVATHEAVCRFCGRKFKAFRTHAKVCNRGPCRRKNQAIYSANHRAKKQH